MAAAEDADEEKPVDLVLAEEDLVEFVEEARRQAADAAEFFGSHQGVGFGVHRGSLLHVGMMKMLRLIG